MHWGSGVQAQPEHRQRRVKDDGKAQPSAIQTRHIGRRMMSRDYEPRTWENQLQGYLDLSLVLTMARPYRLEAREEREQVWKINAPWGAQTPERGTGLNTNPSCTAFCSALPGHWRTLQIQLPAESSHCCHKEKQQLATSARSWLWNSSWFRRQASHPFQFCS